jgi:aminoglycoside phosphotransferase family enzyme
VSKTEKREWNINKSPLPPLIDAMSRPEFYPHHPDRVELRQTHISYVFLAGEYVYKVKKPVRFKFLDYSTLDNRRRFCREEVRLNRRLASAVYLGVVPIIRRGEGFELKEGGKSQQGNTITEYAVKMHRLAEDRMLNSLLAQGKVDGEDLRAIAKRLVAFHKKACEERASVYGAPDVVRRKMLANFQETRQFIGRTICEKEFSEIREYSRRFLAENRDLLERRVREGRIREGHGDLRAEHICLIDDIVVFDCIEFSEELRTGDVASEIAFLAMDLDFLGAPVLSQEWVAVYAELAEDRELLCLIPFYKCYRACVRGKVESLKSVSKRFRRRTVIGRENKPGAISALRMATPGLVLSRP